MWCAGGKRRKVCVKLVVNGDRKMGCVVCVRGRKRKVYVKRTGPQDYYKSEISSHMYIHSK